MKCAGGKGLGLRNEQDIFSWLKWTFIVEKVLVKAAEKWREHDF